MRFKAQGLFHRSGRFEWEEGRVQCFSFRFSGSGGVPSAQTRHPMPHSPPPPEQAPHPVRLCFHPEAGPSHPEAGPHRPEAGHSNPAAVSPPHFEAGSVRPKAVPFGGVPAGNWSHFLSRWSHFEECFHAGLEGGAVSYGRGTPLRTLQTARLEGGSGRGR